ncbi:unnamed protein product [Victoria cruziana]
MHMPPGYVNTGKCYRLKKALYSLKQSPRTWFERLRVVMKNMNFKQGNSDHTLFIKSDGERRCILLVYVDDMIITGSDKEEILRLKQCLLKEFDLKDLGKLRYFFGVEFARSKNGLTMSQRKYTLDLLKETDKIGCRPITTPVENNHKMKKVKYQRLVEKLIYLTLIRPDIIFVVNVVSQFMHAPTDVHMRATERILCYLKKNPGKGLLFTKSENMCIEGHSDADWAGSVDTRRSTTGYCIFLGGNLVIWRSKRQTVCARTSADAEYRAVAMKIIELLCLKIVLRDLGMETTQPKKMFCDNKAAINLANNLVLHDRMKYVELDRHFIRKKIDSKELVLSYVRSEDQVADMFTKGLPNGDFERNVTKLGMFNMYAQLEGEY